MRIQMYFIVKFLVLTFFMMSCESPLPDKRIKAIEISDHPKFSIIDSLTKYAGTDSLYYRDTVNFYVGNRNQKDFGFAQINDSTTIFYQKIRNGWISFDTFYYPLVNVQPTDLNGDGYKDLVVTYGITGGGGNMQNICFIYNPSGMEFKHNKYFDLPNILYDPINNLVYSAWWGGVTHPQEKMSFFVTTDSLSLKEGVIFEPDEKSDGETGTVEFYKIRGAEKINVKKIKGKYEYVFKIFSKALWDSSDE